MRGKRESESEQRRENKGSSERGVFEEGFLFGSEGKVWSNVR